MFQTVPVGQSYGCFAAYEVLDPSTRDDAGRGTPLVAANQYLGATELRLLAEAGIQTVAVHVFEVAPF